MSDDIIINIVQNLLSDASMASTEPPPPRRRRHNYNIIDPYELRDAEFKKHFRLNKSLTDIVISMIEPIEAGIERRTQLDLKTKVLCALHFFGTGSYQTPVGNLKVLDVSQPTASRCISEVVDALNHPSIFNNWVKFPNSTGELNSIAQRFYSAYGFPGVIGCIDCTHVAIVTPCPPYEEHIYVNRKNYHSINTQLICDSNLKILNVNALYPGSTHDSYIWNSSVVLPFMERLHAAGHNNYHLLGDSGYPLRPWCLTPLLQAQEGTPEFHYNEALTRTRATIEQCNGVLKGRFRCLLKDRTLHYQPNKASKIINACCVLHNLCVEHNYHEEAEGIVDNDQIGIVDMSHITSLGSTNASLLQGRMKQSQIINNYFN